MPLNYFRSIGDAIFETVEVGRVVSPTRGRGCWALL
jgi:hypothetical protein